MKPIGLQLYSLREFAKTKEDFADVVRRVADIGYKVVEPAGLHDFAPAEFRAFLDDLGLEMFSSHSPWAHKPEDCTKMIAELGAMRLDKAVCGYGPDDFKDLDAIKRTADNTNAMQEIFAKAGITLFQHNHAFEFERIDGRLKYEIYAELCPDVKFQIDAYWSNNFGANDPVEMMRLFAPRTVLVHLKDGPFKQEAKSQRYVNGILDRKVDLCPVGQGDMDVPALFAEIPDAVPTVIVEHDYSVKDMWQTVEESYAYLVGNGYLAGSR